MKNCFVVDMQLNYRFQQFRGFALVVLEPSAELTHMLCKIMKFLCVTCTSADHSSAFVTSKIHTFQSISLNWIKISL